MTAKTSAIEPKCAALAAKMGLELVEVALDQEGAGKYLRIYLDKPEGLSMDDCEAYHRAIMPQLEAFDYDFLEVSSPGLDRPIKRDRDFERAHGTEVEVHLFKPMNGTKRLNAVLLGLDGQDILLEVGGEEIRLPRKAAALVKPLVDLSGIDEVDLSDDKGEEQ